MAALAVGAMFFDIVESFGRDAQAAVVWVLAHSGPFRQSPDFGLRLEGRICAFFTHVTFVMNELGMAPFCLFP